MLLGRPTEFEAVSGFPLSKFTFFPLVAIAELSRWVGGEGDILNVDSLAYEHPMLCYVMFYFQFTLDVIINCSGLFPRIYFLQLWKLPAL